MAFYDFAVPKQDNSRELAKSIFDNIFVKRVKANKPCIIMLVGDSGEGKSFTALTLAELLFEIQGMNFKDYVNDVVVYSPIEYPRKFDALLHDKRLENVNVIILDEAREVVKASTWYSFVNQAIADINATFRGIKPMVVIVITQFVKDVDLKVRRTVNYYGRCMRPMGQRTHLSLFRLYKDDKDIERPVIRKRKVMGYLVDENGHYIPFIPGYFLMSRPSKEIENIYEETSKAAKSELIRHKMKELVTELEKEYGMRNARVEAAVKHYCTDIQNILSITKRVRGEIKIKKEIGQMIGFDKKEMEQFEQKVIQIMKERGYFANDSTTAVSTVETRPE